MKVGDRHLAALLEGAHDFTDGFAASLAGGNVVDGEMGERGVKAAVGEGHFAHVSVMNADSILDSLQRGISQRGFTRIVGLLPLRPQIDAYRATLRQQLCGGNEQEPMATTDIEHGFVSVELQKREGAVACVEFTEATACEHERREDEKEKAKNLKRISQAEVPAQSPSHDEETADCRRGTNDEHRANGSSSIETIIGHLSAHAFATCLCGHYRDLRFHHG